MKTTWTTLSRLTDAEIKALAKVATIAIEASPYEDKNASVAVLGVRVGHVFAGTETIERRTRGRRYVNARWTRPCWRALPTSPHRVISWYGDHNAFRSRIRAVARLVEFALEDGGVLAPRRAAVLRALRGKPSEATRRPRGSAGA